MTHYNKLVRDKIPEIITAQGGKPRVHTASTKEYEQKLLEKLQEEVSEFLEAKSMEELADVREVVAAIQQFYEWNEASLGELQMAKRTERGAFTKRFILEEA